MAQIANAHTVFNIVTTLLLLPFGTHMANIAVRILPDSKKADDEDLRLKYIRLHFLIYLKFLLSIQINPFGINYIIFVKKINPFK